MTSSGNSFTENWSDLNLNFEFSFFKLKEILSTYKSENNLIFFKDEFEDQPYRGKRLELARNFILEKVRNLNYLSTCYLLIILDFDI